MPMIEQWEPDELWLTYKGVDVYHHYDPDDGAMDTYWFTMTGEPLAEDFDVRSFTYPAVLSSETEAGRHAILRYAIDTKQLQKDGPDEDRITELAVARELPLISGD